jgi:hypothetical protein
LEIHILEGIQHLLSQTARISHVLTAKERKILSQAEHAYFIEGAHLQVEGLLNEASTTPAFEVVRLVLR